MEAVLQFLLQHEEFFIRISGLIVLLLIYVILMLIRGRPWGIKYLFEGEDHRPSTSKSNVPRRSRASTGCPSP